MNKSLLITRPDHDLVTKYLCVWSGDIVTLAHRKGFVVYDLKGKKANRRQFESYFSAHHPVLLFLNGHGNSRSITGHNNESLVEQTSDLQGTIVYARSCDAGLILGMQLVNMGTRSFIGYRRKFFCGYSPEKITKPHQDPIARLFLEPSNLILSTLIKHHTAEEAHRRSKDAMYKNFRRMVSSTASYEERYAARWLWSNINCQVLLGDPQAKTA